MFPPLPLSLDTYENTLIRWSTIVFSRNMGFQDEEWLGTLIRFQSEDYLSQWGSSVLQRLYTPRSRTSTSIYGQKFFHFKRVRVTEAHYHTMDDGEVGRFEATYDFVCQLPDYRRAMHSLTKIFSPQEQDSFLDVDTAGKHLEQHGVTFRRCFYEDHDEPAGPDSDEGY